MTGAAMIPLVLVFVTAMAIFPIAVGRTAAQLCERLDVAGWWAKVVLASAIVGVCCVIYRDAVRLEYARVLWALWREWFGN